MIKLNGFEFKTLLPKRACDSHKGTFGTAAIVAGSLCYQGAAALATRAALLSGAGIVCAFIPDCIYDAFAAKTFGAVIQPLDSKNGIICDNSLTQKILSRRVNAVLCGSGIGIGAGAKNAVEQVSKLDLPVVFDADALLVIAEDKTLLNRNFPTILTPHLGEFSKLINETVDNIKRDRYNLALNFSKKYNCTLVLKDYETVIATPDESYSLCNPTSALSKGGSGDVLAGIICSLVAQGMTAKNASVCAVTIHNRCGHLAAQIYGERAVLAEDIAEQLRKPVF